MTALGWLTALVVALTVLVLAGVASVLVRAGREKRDRVWTGRRPR